MGSYSKQPQQDIANHLAPNTLCRCQIRIIVVLTSFDEVVIAKFVSGGDNPTLTRNMSNALREQIDPTIASISTIMIVATSIMMVLTQVFGRSKADK